MSFDFWGLSSNCVLPSRRRAALELALARAIALIDDRPSEAVRKRSQERSDGKRHRPSPLTLACGLMMLSY